MDETKLTKLKEMMGLLNEGLTRSEFTKAFGEVIKLVTKIQSELIKKIDTEINTKVSFGVSSLRAMKDEMAQVIAEVKKSNDSTFTAIKKRAMESMTAMFAQMDIQGQMDSMTKEHDSMMSAMSDTEKKIEQKMSEMKMSEIISETPAETRDKLETLKGNERLDVSAIKGVDELKKEWDEKISRIPRGGGTSAMGVRQAFKYIAHTEEPVGDIDGVNTIYTVKNDIWWVAGFSLNGEQIAELPNYTYAGHTITFASALPAAYSGKDWEIKYIG